MKKRKLEIESFLKHHSSIPPEHLGMLDDDDYRKKNLKKLSDYRKNGIYTGKNLILTFEGVGSPFNIDHLKKNMEELFL